MSKQGDKVAAVMAAVEPPEEVMNAPAQKVLSCRRM